jgi:hypothetical protein
LSNAAKHVKRSEVSAPDDDRESIKHSMCPFVDIFLSSGALENERGAMTEGDKILNLKPRVVETVMKSGRTNERDIEGQGLILALQLEGSSY